MSEDKKKPDEKPYWWHDVMGSVSFPVESIVRYEQVGEGFLAVYLKGMGDNPTLMHGKKAKEFLAWIKEVTA